MTISALRQSPPRSRGPFVLVAVSFALTAAVWVLMLQSPEASSSSTSSTSAGSTTLDEGDPAVGRLDSDLLGALREAADSAAEDGVRIELTSGWRSRAEQERLYQQAVETYGPEEAARRVARPGTSAHETGDAVDIGDTDAAAWLSRNGAVHGLCQTYANEPWHFELRPDALRVGCPPMRANAADAGPPEHVRR